MVGNIFNTNLSLGGGGIKGISFVGAFDAAQSLGFKFYNISGVSAGAMVGALMGAGYAPGELKRILYEFDFKNIKLQEIPKTVPAVARFMEYKAAMGEFRGDILDEFLNSDTTPGNFRGSSEEDEFQGERGDFFKNIVKFSKQGCLLDGDYLENWVAGMLANRGIRTFADFRGGISDRMNPRGYRVRMTAVDANRARVIILPDDLTFYGVDPDGFSVAKAVRMSCSVPFAFKPVTLQKNEGGRVKTYHIVDGGVFDNFPIWLHDLSWALPIYGFVQAHEEKKKKIGLDTPLNILRNLIMKVHDTGIPKNIPINPAYIINIDTSKVSFLDFDLNDDDKTYMFSQGRNSAYDLFNQHARYLMMARNRFAYNAFRRRYY